MKKAIVVGSGAGGATIAKDLQGKFEVTILEAGKEFRPFSLNLSAIETMKKAHLLFDSREIMLLFPAMKIRETVDKMILVNGVGTGGTTTIACGNCLPADKHLRELGIDLTVEFDELRKEIPIHIEHRKNWRPATRMLFEICEEMKLQPAPMPKMGYAERCKNCGRCVLGCPYNAKWDCRTFLNDAIGRGARLIENCKVEQVVIENGRVTGVNARNGIHSNFYDADLIILAAGGLGTPVILENSGINCEQSLFVDPVLCVAAEWKGALQNKEISMPFVIRQDHFIISPYFDHLSFFFNRDWKYAPADTLSLMVKLADCNSGHVTSKKIEKKLNQTDKERLQEGIEICTEIFRRMGVEKDKLFLGTLNAGHPGGTMPLSIKEAATFHNNKLPPNLYVADSSLFPDSLGNPPIFTIMAMAKRIGRICREN
jgi:choline dehydrogenase-like flavoprotein